MLVDSDPVEYDPGQAEPVCFVEVVMEDSSSDQTPAPADSDPQAMAEAGIPTQPEDPLAGSAPDTDPPAAE